MANAAATSQAISRRALDAFFHDPSPSGMAISTPNPALQGYCRFGVMEMRQMPNAVDCRRRLQNTDKIRDQAYNAWKFDRAWEAIMITLTRRTLLVGTSALAVASTLPFRVLAAARTYRALLVACTDYPNLPKKNWLIGPKNDAALVRDYLLKNTPDPGEVLGRKHHAARPGCRRRQWPADACRDQGGARRSRRQGPA